MRGCSAGARPPLGSGRGVIRRAEASHNSVPSEFVIPAKSLPRKFVNSDTTTYVHTATPLRCTARRRHHPILILLWVAHSQGHGSGNKP